PQGNNSTGLILLASLNGFADTVSLTATVSSLGIGPKVSPTPTSIVLPAGLAVASAANITNANVPGTYTVSVTAKSSALTHTFQMTIYVASKTPLVSIARG